MGAGLSEVVRVPARQAFVVGDIPIEQATMGEPLACVVHSVRLSTFRSGDRVAVLGAGYMGRMHLALRRALGASAVSTFDISYELLLVSSGAGATRTGTPDDALSWSGQHDVVFVTAGTPGAVELALDLCDDGGTVVLYGAFPKDNMANVGADRLHHHELSIVGVYSQEPDDWRVAAGILQSGMLGPDLDRLVTARYGMSDVSDAMDLATSSPVYRVLVG